VRRDHGFTTIQYVVAVGFSLLLLVLFANVMVDLYARGAVRDALDEGVRAAAPAGDPVAVCRARANGVVGSLVRGPLLDANVRCEHSGAFVFATADVSLRSWLPMLVPDWRMRLRAEARLEP